MADLGIDPLSIEVVVLSHIHGDHTDGLPGLLKTGVRPRLYVPASFPSSFADGLPDEAELVRVSDPVEIYPGLHSTGELGKSIVEQALVAETPEGAVVVTGCAHPGIVQIVRQTTRLVDGEIALVVGGFHLGRASQSQVNAIIAELRDLGVRQVCPTHCTGEASIATFARSYGDGYVEGGVGRVIAFGMSQ